jgi:ubiquinone/menaquinone biosynthesis C-methylase UbiE
MATKFAVVHQGIANNGDNEILDYFVLQDGLIIVCAPHDRPIYTALISSDGQLLREKGTPRPAFRGWLLSDLGKQSTYIADAMSLAFSQGFEKDNKWVINELDYSGPQFKRDRHWSDWRSEIGNEHYESVKHRLSLLGVDRQVLEIGCGEGNTLDDLAETFGCRAIGIESDAVLAKRLPRNEKATILEGDAHMMDFPDNAFDAVISCWVLPYCTDKLRVLREAYRVLMPGGWGVIHLVGNRGYKRTTHIRESGKAIGDSDILPTDSRNSDLWVSEEDNNTCVIINKIGRGHPLGRWNYTGIEYKPPRITSVYRHSGQNSENQIQNFEQHSIRLDTLLTGMLPQ